MNEETTEFHREDRELVKAFQTGNKTAFDRLVVKHKGRVFNLCYRFLGDYQDANDAAQEVFVKVYSSLKKFRLESTFSTWLYRIAVNTCKNKVRSRTYQNRKKTVSLNDPMRWENTEQGLEIHNEADTPLAKLERKERAMLVQHAINSLPPEQKTMVVLRDIEGFSYDEIAEITGHNLGTVKSKLSRARANLRTKLRKMK